MRVNDAKILEKLKNGDVSAYKELFDKYYSPLCIYALKYCDSFQMSEDIVQDFFIKFWDEKVYLKLENTIAPYLFKAIKNNTLKITQQNTKYQFVEIEDRINELIDENLNATTIEDDKRKLYQEIEALPDKSKEVFKAIVLNNLKYKEVAEELNISLNTVKTHYSRALKKLRKSLDVIILLFFI